MMNENKPLFTLTAEEVETVRKTFEYSIEKRTDFIISNQHRLNDFERLQLDEMNEEENNLLTRIKQWQDENSRTD